jgi:subtilase family serine protease
MQVASTLRHAASLVLSSSLLIATGAFAQQVRPRGGQIIVPASSIEKPSDIGRRAHTTYKIFQPTGGFPKTEPQAGGGPPFKGYYFETPASLACIYNLVPPAPGCNPYVVSTVVSGGTTSVAIVDAYDDPAAVADLAKFSKQFGLPPANFQVVFATGTRPPNDPNWELEESLDIEWAHAMAPHAKLYLVEAASNSFYDLFTAETVAASLVSSDGGGSVSNSWEGSEFSGESSYDVFFSYPGVVYFASAGDGPGVGYPSASPNVVGVGGTTLSRNPNNGNYLFESAWNSTGGGLSQFETIPTYQKGVAKVVGTQRGVPDVAAAGDPNSGAWVWDSGNGGWFAVGGTSWSSPVWAGIVSAAGNNYGSTAAELTTVYHNRNAKNYNDIKSGVCGPWNGNVALLGYDLCTGAGSPTGLSGK